MWGRRPRCLDLQATAYVNFPRSYVNSVTYKGCAQCALCALVLVMAEKTITATKLRRDLGAVLDAVARGDTVHITRQGRPLCSLVPPGTDTEPTVPVAVHSYDD